MFSSITAFFTALKEALSFGEKRIDTQFERESLKDTHNLRKACGIAMDIIELVERHAYFETVANQDRFNRWAKQFREKVI